MTVRKAAVAVMASYLVAVASGTMAVLTSDHGWGVPMVSSLATVFMLSALWSAKRVFLDE